MITTAHVGLSYRCNMRCKHCFVSKSEKDDVFYLHHKEIIQKLYDQGLYMLFYTYGEPLFSERLYEVAEFANSKDICQVLMTNGSLINEETVFNLKKVGIGLVYVSIDSINATKHDKNRNSDGAWNQAIDAINILIKNGVNTGIACTVTNDNYTELYDIYELGHQLGVNNISFLRCRNNGKIVVFENDCTYRTQMRNIILSGPRDGITIKIHDPLIMPMITELYYENQISEIAYDMYTSMCRCHKTNNINIAPNGDVYRCDFAMVSEGNIEDEKLLLSDEKCTCV